MKHYVVRVLVGLLFTSNVVAAEPDWSDYATVLQSIQSGQKHGIRVTLVDYAALKQNRQLDKVYRQISTFPVDKLNGNKEKLAFYINSYNILAIKMVLDHWPLTSIKDVGSFFSPVWGKQAGIVAGQTVSLDDVENKILRPMADPRIHLAIVCASVSCPDLRNEPYTATKLDQQLDNQAMIFLYNDKKGLSLTKGTIRLSKIFKWFKQDFETVGGVEAFIRNYRPDLPLNADINPDIDYDWSINALNNSIEN